jgi:hypothetical protein
MNSEQIPAGYVPLDVPGLPRLYGPQADWCVWLTTLPLPETAQLRGAGARAPSKGHGYGMMMAGTKTVETGGADVGGLSWIAARHARSQDTGR